MNYFTFQEFAWDCLLSYSGIKLDALTDEDMYLFFEQGIRGGYSNCHKNYLKANHKYLVNYNPDEECVYLIYWDMNSLYPTVMVEKLPVRNFRWGTQKKLDEILELCREGRHNEIPPCTISVDLKHNPEKIFAMCPEFFEENGVKKLSHTLYDKKNYIIHHRTLKYYLDQGMILERVNGVVFYDEEAWMKNYIDFCVEQRKKAELEKNEFLVDF